MSSPSFATVGFLFPCRSRCPLRNARGPRDPSWPAWISFRRCLTCAHPARRPVRSTRAAEDSSASTSPHRSTLVSQVCDLKSFSSGADSSHVGGGCLHSEDAALPGTGTDCLSIPGAMGVACEASQCIVCASLRILPHIWSSADIILHFSVVHAGLGVPGRRVHPEGDGLRAPLRDACAAAPRLSPGVD